MHRVGSLDLDDRVACKGCGVLFFKERDRQAFCNKQCGLDYHARIYREKRKARKKSQNPICPGTYGAISELSVANHLMMAGWHVYRSLSPNAPADLVAIKDEKIMVIEVKTTSASLSVCRRAATHLAVYNPEDGSVRFQKTQSGQVMP